MDIHSGMSVMLSMAYTLMSPYVHALDWLLFVFFVIMMGQPICNKDFRPWFVEDLYPVLMNF